MASYVAASIRIGGRFPRSLIPQLISALEKDGVKQPADEEESHTRESIEDAVEEGALRFYCSQARNGMLESLEIFLQEAEIPYVRYGAASVGEFDPDVSFWNPSLRKYEPATLITNDEGMPIILAQVAVAAWKALCVGNTHAALEVLAPFADCEVPPLPPFEFVDE